MNDSATLALQNFINAFAHIYPNEPFMATTMAISAILSCYSMMEEQDRERTHGVLFDILKDIGSERFEDGNDFIAFLRDKHEEWKGRP